MKNGIEKQDWEFCSIDCPYMDPDEEEQDEMNTKPAHWCLRFNKLLRHDGHHPRIVRLEECFEKDAHDANKCL